MQNTPGGGGEAEEEGEVDIGVSCHDSMAVSLCNKILDNPGHFYVKFLVKILTSLQVCSLPHFQIQIFVFVLAPTAGLLFDLKLT